MNGTVLISGASVAGPGLAYWLKRFGFRPSVVEKANTVRQGGYPIGLRGIAIEVVNRITTPGCRRSRMSSIQDVVDKSFAETRHQRLPPSAKIKSAPLRSPSATR